jgi:hypothetical protein
MNSTRPLVIVTTLAFTFCVAGHVQPGDLNSSTKPLDRQSQSI